MVVSDEFVERRMFKFACYECDHPAMLITKKEELGSNKFKIELACPRCKARDEFILNGEVAEVSKNSDRQPDPTKVI